MTLRSLLRTLALAALVALIATPVVFAQGATTGAIGGIVTDGEGDTALPGAIINAVHEPTGTRYNTVSRADGRFSILNVRVGGPYTISAAMDGFSTSEVTDAFVVLGETLNIEFALQLETVSETIVVTASNPLIDPTSTGPTSNVSQRQIETLPNIQRDLTSIARTNPFFSANADNDGQAALTVAGKNPRYNSIQIDGAVNNDLFGLADTATPGGQAETQPISLDAVQELQLLIAPYDVRQGSFSSGGINAITRSGTNDWKGTAYYFTRDQDLVGDREDGDGETLEFTSIFDEEQYGVSVGGPIVEDKAFFFFNYDKSDRARPSGFSIGGSGESLDFALEDATRFRDIMINTYGFDPGGLGEFNRATENDKYFLRLDFNINDSNTLLLRHNYIDATNQIIRPNQFSYEFPSHAYDFASETNSTVAQLNTIFGSNAFNEARLTLQTVRDNRGGPVNFPYIRVELDSIDFEAGTERFSTANALDQDLLEFSNDFTFIRGNHTITVGTQNEFFEFDNLFIRENNGAYRFSSLEALEAGEAFRYDYSFSATDDPQQSAAFQVQKLSFYAGDQWNVTPTFNLTYGLRLDFPLYPDTPTFNPDALQFGVRTDELPENETWSPRIGFNWDVNGDGTAQLRGGLGYFAGRMPYVWFSNQFSNTGIEFTRILTFGDIPFEPDPNNQPEEIPGAITFTNEIDAIDPDFQFPQTFRASLGYDQELGFLGLIGSVELLYTENTEDILYQNLNVVPSGETMFDGRPVFTRQNSEFSDVIFLTNSSEGEQFYGTFKLERPFLDGWSGFVAYTYGEATSINDGTSSQAISNWRFLPSVNINDPEVSNSLYLVQNRLSASLSWTGEIIPSAPTTVTLFYNHQSGRPYSTTFSNDINGDNQSSDLLYVPRDASEVIVVGGTFDELNSYIEADEGLRNARGSIVDRNESFAPYTTTLDLSIAQDIPLGRLNAQLTFDIENLLNLFDEGSGVVRYVPFGEVSPVQYNGIDADSGLPIYQIRFSDPDNRFATDDLRSRWRARIGVRITY
ncbi:MAG: carboxypeptidase regulatory-like domain-containing protein [Acidobacteriota bacterium]